MHLYGKPYSKAKSPQTAGGIGLQTLRVIDTVWVLCMQIRGPIQPENGFVIENGGEGNASD